MPLIHHIKGTDSTNDYLKSLLQKEDLKEGYVVWSDFQSAGKGQRGNSWESEDGQNLLFSVVLYPDFVEADKQFILSQIISLAVADCLSVYAEGISIKWPNDIYWNEKKICGILLENAVIENRITQSVAGIGLNINQEEFISNAPNPVSLKQITKKKYDLEPILTEVVDNINKYYQIIKSGNTAIITDRYKKSLFRKEGYHLYTDENSRFLAQIDNIEPSGLLVLKTEDGEKKHYAFKEIKYIL